MYVYFGPVACVGHAPCGPGHGRAQAVAGGGSGAGAAQRGVRYFACHPLFRTPCAVWALAPRLPVKTSRKRYYKNMPLCAGNATGGWNAVNATDCVAQDSPVQGYVTLAAAQLACASDSACSGVLSDACQAGGSGGSGGAFRACNASRAMASCAYHVMLMRLLGSSAGLQNLGVENGF